MATTRGSGEGANLSILAEPLQDGDIGLRWQHVSDRVAEIPEAEGYDMVDLTLSWFDPFSSEITLRAGVSNLLDEDRHFLVTRPADIHAFNYSGRRVWLQLAWKR